MAKYRVLRDKGWKSGSEEYAFGRTFESDSKEDAKGAVQGYLKVIDAPVSETPEEVETTTDLESADDGDAFTKEEKAETLRK